MATKKEMRKILDSIEFHLDKWDSITAISDKDLGKIKDGESLEDILYNNAEFIDLKKLLLIEIFKLNEMAKSHGEERRGVQNVVINNMNKVKNIAKEYIKEGEKIVTYIRLDLGLNAERYEMIDSDNIVYGKPNKNENPKYDKYKGILPKADLEDIKNIYNVLEQMFNDSGIARIFYNQVIYKALIEQGVEKDIIVDIFAEKIYKMIDKAEKIIDVNLYDKYLNEQIEKNKQHINADKYLLYKIYKQQVKCENGEELTEEEKKFISDISDMLEELGIQDKINLRSFTNSKFKDKKAYGIENVQNFLSRLNPETGEYITEEQIKNGTKLLEDTKGYEKFLNKSELMKLAENESNLKYLSHKKILSRSDILNILNKVEISEETLIQIYGDGKIKIEDIENYAKKVGMNFDNIKENIRSGMDLELSTLKENGYKQWNLLTPEEKNTFLEEMSKENLSDIIDLLKRQKITEKDVIQLYKNGKISIDIINEYISKQEIENSLNLEEIAEKYKEIYLENKEEIREEYKRLIELYNILEMEKNDDIIELLDEQLSDDMLTNLYFDKVINIDILYEYGGIDLVEELYKQGNISKTDMLQVIEMLEVKLDYDELTKYYTEGMITSKKIIALYLNGIIELKDLKKLYEDKENLFEEDDISVDELLNLYKKQKKSKKSEDEITCKKYGLILNGFKLSQMSDKEKRALEDKIMQENSKWLNLEDIKNLYKMNILSMEILYKYCGKSLINELITKGDLRPKDAKKIYGILSKDKLEELDKILKNPKMEDIQKLIFIYSTFGDNKKVRDKLIGDYLSGHTTDIVGNGVNKRGDVSISNPQNKVTRKTVTDPYERWNLFSMLDDDYTKEYYDGYVIISFPEFQKTIIEKMFSKKNEKIVPAHGVATFIMSTDEYQKIKDQIITKNGRINLGKLRKIVKEDPAMSKVTHHSPNINAKGQEVTSWGKRVLTNLLDRPMEEIYNKEEIDQINGCLKNIENSRIGVR